MMTYEIPPPLQHKEKIMFNLTFSQLAYALPSFLLILVLCFKFDFSWTAKIVVSCLIASTAIFFMFFSGVSKIKSLIRHLRNQNVTIHSEQITKIIDLQKITDNVIHTSKDKIAIIEITPLNLLIKTKDEQQSLIQIFQKFCNSLDFPIQIHISTSKISLEKHYKHVQQHAKPELAQDYINFLQTKTEAVQNRKFYLIIKEKRDIETQVNVCQQKLLQCGLKNRRLQDMELLSLFQEYVGHNQDKELSEDEIVKNYTHYLCAPKTLQFGQDSFQMDDLYCSVLAVRGYPASVEIGFLDKIIANSANYDVSMHIDPYPIETTMVALNQELRKQQADLYTDSQKGILNPSLDIKFKSTRQVLEALQKGQQKLFNVSLYILCKGKSREEVQRLTSTVKAELDSVMMQTTKPKFRMLDAYQSMLPLAKDQLNLKRNIHTQGLSAFFPFSSPFLDVDSKGTLLGLNKNNIPYIKDVFNLTNANGVVLATSGAGKSYFTKLFISRQFMNGTDVMIIDPQGEYQAITKQYKGQVITISKDSPTMINPLDLMGHEYSQKRLTLLDLFDIMFGGVSEIQRAILDQALDATYAKKGITTKSFKGKKPPKLEDLYKTLRAMERKASSQEKVTYTALLNRLKMYTDTGVFSFLNKQTNINVKNKFVCFNIGNMPKQVKPVIMYLILDYVYMRMKKSKQKKLLVLDEAWSMLQRAQESSYVFEIVKTCRKFNLGLLMITQDVADLLGSKAGSAVLANSSYTFLLRQKPAVINSVVKTFHLSEVEKQHLLTAEKGQGVVLVENEHQELNVIASKKEHELITTNPNEEVVEQVVEKEDVTIDLDTEKDVYPMKELSIEEQNYLSHNGYVVGNFHNLKKGRQQPYFVKVRKPESPQHSYYVNLIMQELLKKTKDVKRYLTEKPDIVFTNKAGEEIVIEVETGFGLKKKKKAHDKKFNSLREEYGKRCYIFLHYMPNKNSYARHNLPIIGRLQIQEFVKSQFSGKSNSIIVQDFDLASD